MPMRLRPRDRYLDQLTRELELSADQRAQIEALLQRQQERMRALRQEERQRSGAVVAETRAGLFEILTPEQRVTLQRSGRPQARGRGS
jgi:Spy/CpxP family protein refolding chaperone